MYYGFLSFIYIVSMMLQNKIKPFIKKSVINPEMRDNKAYKCAKHIPKLINSIILTFIHYSYMTKVPWNPSLNGGTGSLENLFIYDNYDPLWPIYKEYIILS